MGDFIAKSKIVKHPGSHGGHPWLDKNGHWRYGPKPKGEETPLIAPEDMPVAGDTYYIKDGNATMTVSGIDEGKKLILFRHDEDAGEIKLTVHEFAGMLKDGSIQRVNKQEKQEDSGKKWESGAIPLPKIGDQFDGPSGWLFTVTGTSESSVTLQPNQKHYKSMTLSYPEEWEYWISSKNLTPRTKPSGEESDFQPPMPNANDDERAAMKKRVVAKLFSRLRDNVDFVTFARKKHPYLDAEGNVRPVSDITPGVKDSQVYRTVNDLVGLWATTVSDGDTAAQAVQRAVREEFNLGEPWDCTFVVDDRVTTGAHQKFLDSIDKHYRLAGKAYRAFVRAQYEETQQFLASKGKAEVTVYRGIYLDSRDTKIPKDWKELGNSYQERTVHLQPASSFATSENMAERFAFSVNSLSVYPFVVKMRIPASRILSTARTGVGCLNEREIVVLGGEPEQALVQQPEYEGWKTRPYDEEDADIWKSLDRRVAVPIDKYLHNADWAKRTPDPAVDFGERAGERAGEIRAQSRPGRMLSMRSLVRSLGEHLWGLLSKAEEPAGEGQEQPKKSYGDPPAGSRWITVHPHGSEEGHPVLVMPAAGRKNVWHVIGGANGRLNHMELHLNSPEEWAKHAKERAAQRAIKEKESGITPENKAGIKNAKDASAREYVRRVAEQMGWQDYSEKTADDFLAQAKGNKTQAALLAHQYLRSYISKANQAVKELRVKLVADQDAFAAAHLGLSKDPDPYRADENDLIAGDISQRMEESRKVGNSLAAEQYQQTLDAMSRGDTEAAKTYLTSANKAAGIRSLILEDILPSESVSAPSGKEPVAKQARESIVSSGALNLDALKKRADEAGELAKGDNEIDKYTGGLEAEAIQKAIEVAGGDPTKTDLTQAATYYLQAEKFRALRQKFGGDVKQFESWKGMREMAMANAAAVRAVKAEGGFGAADVDPDVTDMAKAKGLLAAKVLYDERIKRLKEAQRSLDPREVQSAIDEQTPSEAQVDWDAVYDAATKKALEQIQQSQDTAKAAELDTAVDDPTAFLQGVGEGELIDQQHLSRYIAYGRESVAQLVGEVVGGAEMLPRTAYDALGVKTASRLMANYLAATRAPEEFEAIREGIGRYHEARQFDVANGALVAATAVLSAAKESKQSELDNIDNLYEAAKYNKLRLEAVDHALATLGTAYGELNATAELYYALQSAKPGQKTLTIDGDGRDAAGLVALAHALHLEQADYTLTNQVKDEEGNLKKPAGLELSESGVKRLFHEAPPSARERRKRLMDIRAGKEDDLLPDGKRATDGWLPPYFAKWPASLANTPPRATSASRSDEIHSQVLADPQVATKAVAYALGKQPLAVAAFKDYGKLTPDDFKLLRAYFASRSGNPPAKETKPGEEDAVGSEMPSPDAATTDIFGNKLLSSAVKANGTDAGSKAWNDLVHRVGAKNAIELVQGALKGEFLDTFAPLYESFGGKKLSVGQEPLPGGKADRVTIGDQAEAQLGQIIDKIAWRYPGGKGAGSYQIPGVSMSGKYVKQQRVIKSLDASGGLNGRDGGRLGGFLGTGCIRGDTPIYNPVLKETKSVHEWMMRGVSFHVYAYDEATGCKVVASASRPFIKGFEMMYAVSLSSGETMHVTAAHRFLTPEGWRRLDELVPGSRLVAAPSRPDSSRPFGWQRRHDAPASRSSLTTRLALRWFPQCVSSRDSHSQVDAVVLSILGRHGVVEYPRAFVPRHPPTNWGAGSPGSLGDEYRWTRTLRGSPGHCYWGSRRDGEQFLLGVIADQAFLPSQGDVLARTPPDLPLGVRASGQGHNHPCRSFFHPSILHFSLPDVPPAGWRQRFRISCESNKWPHQSRRAWTLSLCRSFREKLALGHTRDASRALMAVPLSILSITPTSAELVYDLTVPVYHNYVVFSTISHNSGKTNVSIGAFTNLLAQGKARQAIYSVPSAVEGQFGPAIAGVIDPESPLKWHVQPNEPITGKMRALSDPDTHIVTMTHESLREVTTRALAGMWGVPPKDAADKFMGMTRQDRAAAVKQAFEANGWGNRLDFFSPDEAHRSLNRRGKKNALLANVMDAISDNAKYYLPLTGTPVKNDPSEVYDWLSKLRPDEYPPEKISDFLARHQLLAAETARLQQTKAQDKADGKPGRDWTTNAAAEALQNELGANFYSSAAPISIPVTEQKVGVDLSDMPAAQESDVHPQTLQELMSAGMQKSAYGRVGELERAIKLGRQRGDWKSVAAAIRELTTHTFTDKKGRTSVVNAFTDKGGPDPVPGSPEEETLAKRLAMASGMMRDGAYNRVLHTMVSGNNKTEKVLGILDDLSRQQAAKDNGGGQGKPVIIFTSSLDAVGNLTKILREKGYNVAGISGNDSGQKKLSKKELFQPSGDGKPKVDVLVMSDAMSAGVDLPRAEAVIHYDTPNTSMVQEQRSARAVRLSTKHPVTIYSLVSNTPYEARRTERVAGKGALGDVTQNPADVLDDTSLAKYIVESRATTSRKVHETPPENSAEAPQ